MTILFAMAAAPLIDRALYGPSGITLDPNKRLEGIKLEGWNIKGPPSYIDPPEVAKKPDGPAAGGAENNPKYPGNDPYKPPTPDYEWRGDPQKGSWYNPKTGEVLRSDVEHGDPIGPHWDYRGPDGRWYRLFPDGHIEPK